MALEQATVVRILMAERSKLLAYIWSIVRDEHAVEDVFQEVSILAVEKCGQITDENCALALAPANGQVSLAARHPVTRNTAAAE